MGRLPGIWTTHPSLPSGVLKETGFRSPFAFGRLQTTALSRSIFTWIGLGGGEGFPDRTGWRVWANANTPPTTRATTDSFAAIATEMRFDIAISPQLRQHHR